MTLNIPFVYKATVIKPKCRNTTEALIEDSISVDIAEYDNLPVAFKVGSCDYYWDNKSLWTIVAEYDRDSNSNKNITLEELKRNTENPHKDLKNHHMESPFYKFSKYKASSEYPYTEYELNYSSKDEAIKQNRDYIKDNKDGVVSQIKAIAESIIFHKGLLYEKTKEPVYKICVFGLGGNHGSTDIFIENGFNSNSSKSAYYSALEYDLAVKRAIKTATNRRDTDSIGSLENFKKIEVLINEAVQIDMTKEINELTLKDLTPLNLLEMTKDDFLILINERYFEEYERKIRVLDFEANFIKDGINILILDSQRVA